ncbi:LysR family transcriptional regulator [Tropicibacter oceani]|uniref:LysR family transcriptional regulator n=1 Tax=Tropicibacter oceani TaxID=3058420 RepID=A0ABY8QPA7_9RHOB|nr:LysR family transcriptional regulator [Tropicibacter oceani]WGW05866.1 LysR family transcriptional regulator [Tropicibacter oceani]
MNWDDLRHVLMVAEKGSVAAAARALGVNHATVLRRIAAFEEAAGGPVFERHAQGYRLRPDRVPVIEAARRAAEAMEQAGQLMRGKSTGAAQVLRVTSVDTLCAGLLAREHARIARRVAPYRLALISANTHLDMARLQADVAVRPANALPEGMVGDAPCTLGFGVYAAPGAPETWLGLTGPIAGSPAGQWAAQCLPQDDLAASADSFVVLRELALAGQGRAILPCILGDACAGLTPLPGLMPRIDVPVWVACHRDLAGAGRIESLRAALVSVLRANAGALAGQH